METVDPHSVRICETESVLRIPDQDAVLENDQTKDFFARTKPSYRTLKAFLETVIRTQSEKNMEL
jgi:hypothetical protein